MAGRVPGLLQEPVAGGGGGAGDGAGDGAWAGEDAAAGAALDSLGRGLQATPVARLFFHPVNVDALQHGIRYGVYRASGLVVGRQSERQLGLVMRSVYLQHARNREAELVGQVRELNALVLEYCVPVVHREARMYQTYLRDASTLPEPLPRGELATMKGERTLEVKRFL